MSNTYISLNPHLWVVVTDFRKQIKEAMQLLHHYHTKPPYNIVALLTRQGFYLYWALRDNEKIPLPKAKILF